MSDIATTQSDSTQQPSAEPSNVAACAPSATTPALTPEAHEVLKSLFKEQTIFALSSMINQGPAVVETLPWLSEYRLGACIRDLMQRLSDFEADLDAVADLMLKHEEIGPRLTAAAARIGATSAANAAATDVAAGGRDTSASSSAVDSSTNADLPAIDQPTGRQIEIYSRAHLEARLAEVEKHEDHQPLAAMLKRLLRGGAARSVRAAPTSDALDEIFAQCPNFGEVISRLKEWSALARAGTGTMNIMPILLLGEPGIGKTHFARLLGEVMNVPLSFVPMNATTAGWALTGSHQGWRGASMGAIAKALLAPDATAANPIVLLDELDKAGGGDAYPTLESLYQLLEPSTARSFVDEHLGFPIDASHIFFIATANDTHSIPEPLLSRMAVFEIRNLTRTELSDLAARMYSDMRSSLGLASMDADLPESVRSTLALGNARTLRASLMGAAGRALLAGRNAVALEDLQTPTCPTRRPAGFLG